MTSMSYDLRGVGQLLWEIVNDCECATSKRNAVAEMQLSFVGGLDAKPLHFAPERRLVHPQFLRALTSVPVLFCQNFSDVTGLNIIH